MKKKMILWMLVMAAGIFLLSACSSGEDSSLENTEGMQEKESSADLNQFADVKGQMWDDSWSAKTASGVSYNIDLWAKVEIPELQQMSVVEVQRYEFNEENKKKVAQAIFGGEVYLFKKGSKSYEEAEGDYKGNDYTGKRDEIQYQLSFHEEDGVNEISMTACDQVDVYPDWLEVGKKGCYTKSAHISMEVHNKCKVAKADAEKSAREFLQKAGFTDLILADEQTLQWIGGENPFIDGWVFVFSPGVENMPLSDYLDYYDDIEQISGSVSSDCSITVKVTDKGVIEAKIANPVIVISVTSNVKLLPLEEIKKIFKDEIKRYGETTEVAVDMRFDVLTLGYCRVSDPVYKDMYTYVPAWKLASKIQPFIIMLNAMDGSLINNDWVTVGPH